MASPIASRLTCMVLMLILVGAPLAQAITCGQVSQSLSPCIDYLRKGGAVPPGCCNGVRSLNSAAKTTVDRQQTCKCLKSLAGSISGLNPSLVSGLPSKCGVTVPYKISTSTDCTKVH